MNSNTFGTLYCLTTFGESHAPDIGDVIDGCRAGLLLSFNKIEDELTERKSGQKCDILFYLLIYYRKKYYFCKG